MEEKKPFGTRLEAFFAGKGFYIVLLLCVAVIGVSVWSMLSGGQNTGEDFALEVAGIDAGEPVSDTVPATVTEKPVAQRPKPTEAPAETEAPPPTEAPKEETAQAPAPAPAEQTESSSYFIWPVSGEIETGYAMAALVYDHTMMDWRTHDGLDIAAEIGTQVRAAANGTVTAVYDDERYGTTVELRHSGGLVSVYANLAATPAVGVGQELGVGQVVGAVGDTALCEIGAPAHLHFAMTKDGVSIDPTEILP